MLATMGYGSAKPLEKVMIFIDGGYIRSIFKELCGDDDISYWKLRNDLQFLYNHAQYNHFQSNLVRAYYYDGIPDKLDPKYEEQKKYIDNLKDNCIFMEARIAEAVRDGRGNFRQKGVDVLLAIDSLSMAYMDLYDSGLFLLGDRDFIPLIDAIKDTGKKTYGFLYEKKVSKALRRTFDYRIMLSDEMIKKWHNTKCE